MSNDKTITETLPVMKLKVHFMGVGYQCESPDVEGLVGMGETRLEAISDYLERYAEKFRFNISGSDISFSIEEAKELIDEKQN